MAIKIIKHGETHFKITCPICGCEFEYDKEDTQHVPGQKPYVKCPDCESYIEHKQTKKIEITWDKNIDTVDKTKFDKLFYVNYKNSHVLNTWPDCENCLNKPDPNKIVVGDTPCTWCIKNQPYCTNSDLNLKSTIVESGLDNTINWTISENIKENK